MRLARPQSPNSRSAPRAAGDAASISTALLLFLLLVSMTLVALDLARQRSMPIKGQMGYRYKKWVFRIGTADIQAAENATYIPGMKNVDHAALGGDGDVWRLLCQHTCQIWRDHCLDRQ